MRRPITHGSLYRLIYRSRSLIAQIVPEAATAEGLQRELRCIVTAARERNRVDNVTSALLLAEAGFSQVLEGPRDVVERIFERIAADRRHADVTVLSFTPTPRRSFPDWPMGFTASETELSSGMRAMTGSDVLRLLERVVQQEGIWTEA